MLKEEKRVSVFNSAESLTTEAKIEKQIPTIEKDISLNFNQKEDNSSLKPDSHLKYGLKEICGDLSNKFEFGNIKLFFDVELNKICILNYFASDKFEVFKYIDKQALKSTIVSMLKTRMNTNDIQKFELDKNSITKILESVQGVKKAFNKNQDVFYTDSDYMPTLNLFIKTDLLKSEIEKKISFDELKNILSTKFQRLNLVLDNVLTKDSESQKWFMNWFALEINNPDSIMTSMVLIGEQGSGKSLILEQFSEAIYDRSNISILDNKTLKDNFNDIYNGKAFVIMNEVSTMDLKENNQIAQDLKRLITDGTYMNRGMYKSGVEKTKTFNIGFATNKNVPIQIENGDRRFSIFGRSQKLLENTEIKKFLSANNEAFNDFIEQVKKDIKQFVYYIKALDYDRDVATVPFENEIKRKIVQQSNKKEDLLISYINNKEYESFEQLLRGFEWKEEEEFFTKIKYMWETGIFDNRTLLEIYNNFFNHGDGDFRNVNIDLSKQSGNFWSKILKTPNRPQVKFLTEVIKVKVFEDTDIDIKKNKLKCILSKKYDEISKCGKIEIIYEDEFDKTLKLMNEESINQIKSFIRNLGIEDIKERSIILKDKDNNTIGIEMFNSQFVIIGKSREDLAF